MKKQLKEDLEDINYRGQDIIMSCPNCGSENLESITGDIDHDGNISYVKYRCKDCLSTITANIDIEWDEPEYPSSITIINDQGPDDFDGIEEDIELSDEEEEEIANDVDEDDIYRDKIQELLDSECDEISSNYNCRVSIDYDDHWDWKLEIGDLDNYADLKKLIESGKSGHSWIHHLIYYYLIDDLEAENLCDENYHGFKLEGSSGHKYYY